jgi:prepilin signal peptidase PulO-like enzyme (type II secretory pathway)
LVEALTGLAFVAAFWRVGPSAALVLAWAFIAVVVTLAFISHDLLVVPNRIAIPAIACGLAASMALDRSHWWQYIAGCAGAGLVVFAVGLLRPGAARLSDAKMGLLVGAVLGPYALVALPAAVILGIIAGGALLFGDKYRLRARTVFVPSLAAGAVTAICFGQLAFQLYTSR